MKKIIFALLFSSLTIAAENKPPVAPPRYRHVQQMDGKILATIDSQTHEIDYKENPKKVVEELVKIVDAITAQCNQEITALKAPKVVESKKK